MRKFYFVNRVVDHWNSLPWVVAANNIIAFKIRLDKHWQHQDIQDAQLSQRDRAAVCVIVFAKSRTLELGDNDLRTL